MRVVCNTFEEFTQELGIEASEMRVFRGIVRFTEQVEWEQKEQLSCHRALVLTALVVPLAVYVVVPQLMRAHGAISRRRSR